jgi:hypothetical protein
VERWVAILVGVLGKTPDPFLEEIAVEDEIPLSPANQHRCLLKPVEIFLGLLEQSIGGICRSEGDILDKPEGGDPVLPGVIRTPVGVADLSRHSLPATQIAGSTGKGIESQDEKLSHPEVFTQGERPVKWLARREEKGSCVQDDQS